MQRLRKMPDGTYRMVDDALTKRRQRVQRLRKRMAEEELSDERARQKADADRAWEDARRPLK